MIISWIYGALAVGGIIVTAISGERYRRKYNALKSEYDKRCEELTNALGEVGRVKIDNESIREANKLMSREVREYKHLLHSGCRNLKTKGTKVNINGDYCAITVIGQDTLRSDLYFVIKDFHFNPNDPSDREFAIREAEELIETINKA